MHNHNPSIVNNFGKMLNCMSFDDRSFNFAREILEDEELCSDKEFMDYIGNTTILRHIIPK